MTRAERHRRTRDQLLDAAERTFARLGFHGASLDAIATEAGFTKGAVYSNFQSKEALFLALLDRRRRVLEARLDAFSDGVRAALGENGRVEDDDERWGLLTIEFFLYAVREPAARQAFADLYAATRRALAKRLELAPAAERPPDLTPYELATVALALSTGIGVQAALDPTAVPRDLYERVIAGLTGTPVADGPDSRGT